MVKISVLLYTIRKVITREYSPVAVICMTTGTVLTHRLKVACINVISTKINKNCNEKRVFYGYFCWLRGQKETFIGYKRVESYLKFQTIGFLSQTQKLELPQQ